MTHITHDTSRGQIVAFVFGQDALAASQTDVQLPTAIGEGSQAVTGYTMPFGGQVVALAYDLSAAGTTGTFTIGATIGGTENANTTVTVGTTVTGQKIVGRGVMPFVAGNILGAEITTGGTWDGVSVDLTVVVYVLFDLEGI